MPYWLGQATDGKISLDFWSGKLESGKAKNKMFCSRSKPSQKLTPPAADGKADLELANKAHFLYVRQNPAGQAKLLKMALSNCTIDVESLYPSYRKPFDLIFRRAKGKEWRARRDSKSRPIAPELFLGHLHGVAVNGKHLQIMASRAF
jgi:hypothetical protein